MSVLPPKSGAPDRVRGACTGKERAIGSPINQAFLRGGAVLKNYASQAFSCVRADLKGRVHGIE
jgi:hypothetical protein